MGNLRSCEDYLGLHEVNPNINSATDATVLEAPLGFEPSDSYRYSG